MSDLGSLLQILGSIKVDEIYHLAAQSHVGVSFETPLLTSDTNALGTIRLLETMRILKLEKTTRFYNVSNIIKMSRTEAKIYRRLLQSYMDPICLHHRLRKHHFIQSHHMLYQNSFSSGPQSISEKHMVFTLQMVFFSTTNLRDVVSKELFFR